MIFEPEGVGGIVQNSLFDKFLGHLGLCLQQGIQFPIRILNTEFEFGRVVHLTGALRGRDQIARSSSEPLTRRFLSPI